MRLFEHITDIISLVRVRTKFRSDVLWNALSFGVMAASGIALNVLLVAVYGAATLGVFNQVYAVYIIASQLAAWGLYASVLKHVSEYSTDPVICGVILGSAMTLGMVVAGLVCAVYFLGAPVVGNLLDSPAVATGMLFSVTGLWCFALNKILLSFINGQRRMRAFALFNIWRYLSLPLFLIMLMMMGIPGTVSPVVFTLTEVSLLAALLMYIARGTCLARVARPWMGTHLVFGSKALVGGAVTEMNTRVDLLMLGYFQPDRIVGIYSFVAMLAEGIDQIPSIFRVNYNPLLTQYVVTGRLGELPAMIRGFVRRWMPAAVVTGLLAVLGFPWIIHILPGGSEVSGGWWIFAILAAGVVLKSGYSVFWELPVQSGYPGRQTVLITLVLACNVALNALFIPLLGMYGAALATAASFILSVYWLKIMVRRLIGIHI